MQREWTWPDSAILTVLDGDTFDALLTRDIGFYGFVTFPVRLRLNRINAPALHTFAGADAHAYATSLLIQSGMTATLTTLKAYKYGAPVGKTGEWMAEVALDNGDNLSDEMVKAGHAVYWDGVGSRPNDS